MVEYVAKRDPKRCPTYPGELLREVVIPATGKTRSEIAALLGISRQHLYDIVNERKPVSRLLPSASVSCSAMALESGLECRAHMILGMQSANLQVRSGEYPRSRRRWREKSERALRAHLRCQATAIFVVFTLRRRGDDILVRPTSARYMHDKEVESYEKENPNL